MKILICLSGASCIKLSLRLIDLIKDDNEVFVIFSSVAKEIVDRFNLEIPNNITILKNDDLFAPVSSGSFGISKTLILPCSINTLAKISNGICDNLITRSAAVALKERKKLILGIREMPLSAISLSQMTNLANLGVIIAPPIIAEYSNAKSLQDLENFIIGKYLDLLDIPNLLYERWK